MACEDSPHFLASSAKQFERCVCWDLSHIQVFRRDRLFRTFILYVKANSLFICRSFVHGVVYYLWIFMFCFNLPWTFLNETYKFLFTIKVDEYTCKGIESCSLNGSLMINFIWKCVIQCQVMEDSQSKFCYNSYGANKSCVMWKMVVI